MDIGIRNWAVFKLGGLDILITDSIRSTWFIMAILLILAVITRIALKNFKTIPKGFQNVIETLVEACHNFVKKNAGERQSYLGGWFFTVAAYLLLSNLSGLIPFFNLRPPTADWTVTITFALSTIFLIHFCGVKNKKGGYLKSFLEPFPVFLPINLIGEVARPFSLSFRMFGNVLAGYILGALIYGMIPVFLKFGVPIVIHAYLDVFSGLLQAFVFCMLSLTFIGSAAD